MVLTAVEEFVAPLVGTEATRLMQSVPAHRPEDGAIGDCFRTCIACLLEARDPTWVPHFAELASDEHGIDKSGWECLRLARHWIRENTLYDLMTVKLEAAIEYDVYYLLTVGSKTGPWPHCVIGRGGEVVHDPSGVGGYTLADKYDDTAGVLCAPYLPDPDEMVRRWAEAELAEGG